jgi:tRNA 2-selenouridine synthase
VGRERLAHWRALAEAGDFEPLAYELMEGHYDPAYDRSSRKDQRPVMAEVRIEELSPSGQEAAADAIAAFVADESRLRKFS